MSNKTVYILGAGFSMPAGAPSQAGILEGILNYKDTGINNNIPYWIGELKIFLNSVFNMAPESLKDISLEDIYTPIDRCITENSSLKGYSTDYLKKFKWQLNTLVSIIIQDQIQKSGKDKSYIYEFANYLLSEKIKAPTTDKFSIISTNWDIILDNALWQNIVPKEGVIDYGCHVVGLGSDNSIIPPLVAQERGYYTIKLLKVHGSLNWLKCPNCQRIFVSKIEKIAIPDATSTYSCQICKKQEFTREEQGNGLKLTPHLIMPTYLKSLDDVQTKLIWKQAAQELSEASKIVFIGYSFPQADFELRQLLARYAPTKSKVEVILYSKDCKGPEKGSDEYWISPEFRFASFFGLRLQSVAYDGVENFVKKMKHDPTTTRKIPLGSSNPTPRHHRRRRL